MPLIIPTTPIAAIPIPEARATGQAVVVAEALSLLDIGAFGQCRVEDIDLTAPPGGESNGQVWIPAATATGAWAGYEDYYAIYLDGWIFKSPQEGYRAWVKDEDKWIRYSGSAWVDDTAATGQQQYRWAAKAANFSADKTESDAYKLILSSDITIMLPAAATNAQMVVHFKLATAGYTATIDGNSTETIDGAETITLSTQYDSVTLSCDGTEWFIL